MSERREQILHAARELLVAGGATGPSVRAVAARAGVGASTLRHYFPTQGELLRAVFASISDGRAFDARIADRDAPASDRLVAGLAQLLPPSLPVETWLAVLGGMLGSESSEGSRLAWTDFAERSLDRVVGWLRELRAQDALVPGDLDRQARLLLTVVDGLAAARMLSAAEVDAERELAVLHDAVHPMLRPA
jgi:AcrR family transcriptional regulator